MKVIPVTPSYGREPAIYVDYALTNGDDRIDVVYGANTVYFRPYNNNSNNNIRIISIAPSEQEL